MKETHELLSESEVVAAFEASSHLPLHQAVWLGRDNEEFIPEDVDTSMPAHEWKAPKWQKLKHGVQQYKLLNGHKGGMVQMDGVVTEGDLNAPAALIGEFKKFTIVNTTDGVIQDR